MANETNTLLTPDEAPDHTVQDTTEFHEAGDQQGQEKPAPKKEEKEEKEEAGEKTYFVDETRQGIIERARKAKQETSLEFTGSDSDPKVRYGTDVDESDLGPLEQEALARQRELRGDQQQDNQGQQDTRQQQQQRPLHEVDPDLLTRQVKIVVNGQEQIITVEEALRRAQKIAAADDYFVQAKDTLREVKELRHEIARRPNQGDEQGDGRQRDDQQYDDLGERRDTSVEGLISDEDAEKIQMGTTEEVKATMAKLLAKAAAKEVPQVDVAQEVRTTLEAEKTANAMQAYAKDYPQDFSDPVFSRVIADHARDAMVEDIINSGITMEQLRETVKSVDDLKLLHRTGRQRGIPGFRSPAQITQQGHQKAVEWRTGKPFQPKTQQQNPGQNDTLNLQQREARKAQLPPQPQLRRQAQAPLSQQNKSQDQGRSSRFAEIKKARGQPT